MASRSRRRSGGGGGGDAPMKVIWAVAILGLLFAFYQVPYDPGAKGIFDIAKSKADSVKIWVDGIAPSIEQKVSEIIQGGKSQKPIDGVAPGTEYETGGSGNNEAPVEEVKNSLSSLVVAPAAKVAYDRDEWKHWSNVRSCWTVREAVLARDATAGSLVLKDSNGNATTDLNTACEVISGTWVDPYSGKTVTDPKALDIDHMIPLKYAATHGGQAWDAGKKEAYANDMSSNTHLLAVDAGENRTKGEKGPGSWKPTNQGHWCAYAKNWVSVSKAYSLTISDSDVKGVNEMLATCK